MLIIQGGETARIRVWSIVEQALAYLTGNFAPLHLLAVLPWALTAALSLVIDTVTINSFGGPLLPLAVVQPVWELGAAMVFVAVLRHMSNAGPVTALMSLRLDRQIVLTAIVLYGIFVVWYFVSNAHTHFIILQAIFGADELMRLDVERQYKYVASLRLVTHYVAVPLWLSVTLMSVASIVYSGSVDVRDLAAFVRRHFWQLLAVTLLFLGALLAIQTLWDTLFFVIWPDEGSFTPAYFDRAEIAKRMAWSVFYGPYEILHNIVPPVVIGSIWIATRPTKRT